MFYLYNDITIRVVVISISISYVIAIQLVVVAKRNTTIDEYQEVAMKQLLVNKPTVED